MAGDELGRRYEEACADLKGLGFVVEGLLEALLAARGIRAHSVSHRIKTEESVRRKLANKDGAYAGLGDMHDLLGLRVITFFPDEVDVVAGVIESEFEIDVENSVDKRSILDPDRFGYLSLHYVAGLNTTRSSLAENARFAECKFEVQIRSILQHAWAEIEHDLGYHAPGSVPDPVRRRFSRLAGLLEIADDEFLRLRDDVEDYRVEVEKDVSSAPEVVSINRDSIAALVLSDPVIAEVDEDFAAILGLTRISEPQERSANARAEEMLAAGFESVGELVHSLIDRRAVLKRFFAEWSKIYDINDVYKGMCLFMLGYVVAAEKGSFADLVVYLREINIDDRNDREREATAEQIRGILGIKDEA